MIDDLKNWQLSHTPNFTIRSTFSDNMLTVHEVTVYLLRSDSKELQSWVDTINFVCASFSAQPLAGAVGSQRKFQRPLLPCSHTKLNLVSMLEDNRWLVPILAGTGSLLKNGVFWDVTPCGSCKNRRFAGT
jgi:hypothetical protein